MVSMTGFREADHPRIGDGTFTDKEHSAPELALGKIPEYRAVAIPAYWHEPNVLPTPRHTKPRTVTRTLEATATFPVTTSEDAPVGFVLTTKTYRGGDAIDVVEEFRVHEGKLYHPLTENIDGVTRPVQATGRAIRARAFHILTDGRVNLSGDTENEALADAQSHVDGYISIDDELWAETSEPIYYARTYGMGGNHGHTALHVGTLREFSLDTDTAAPDHIFHAGQRDEAIAYTLSLAEERGDTNSLAAISDPETIDVHGDFIPGSTFTVAPRLTYPDPFNAHYAERYNGDTGALERGLAQFREQLLTVPGAVIDVPDGWGGTTKRLDESKLTEKQARDYEKYVSEIAALERG